MAQRILPTQTMRREHRLSMILSGFKALLLLGLIALLILKIGRAHV